MDFARGRLGCAPLVLKDEKKACVFVEDAGRRCGRRGQRSHFRLEDAKSIIQVKKKSYIHLLDLRLPGKCVGGVHVFQGVFQRLPTEHEGFRNVATSCNTFFCLVQEAVVTSSLRYNVAAT